LVEDITQIKMDKLLRRVVMDRQDQQNIKGGGYIKRGL
jgi:hypothetical protein